MQLTSLLVIIFGFVLRMTAVPPSSSLNKFAERGFSSDLVDAQKAAYSTCLRCPRSSLRPIALNYSLKGHGGGNF